MVQKLSQLHCDQGVSGVQIADVLMNKRRDQSSAWQFAAGHTVHARLRNSIVVSRRQEAIEGAEGRAHARIVDVVAPAAGRSERRGVIAGQKAIVVALIGHARLGHRVNRVALNIVQQIQLLRKQLDQSVQLVLDLLLIFLVLFQAVHQRGDQVVGDELQHRGLLTNLQRLPGGSQEAVQITLRTLERDRKADLVLVQRILFVAQSFESISDCLVNVFFSWWKLKKLIIKIDKNQKIFWEFFD